MLNMINKYRSSPNRRYAVIGLKSSVRIIKGGCCKCGTDGAFTELKTVKRAGYQCNTVFRVRLCDMAAVLGGIVALCLIFKRKKSDRSDQSAGEECVEQ